MLIIGMIVAFLAAALHVFIFYIEAFAGIAVYFLASPTVGLTLALFGVGSMLAAALLLFVASPDKRSAAIKQGFLPLIAVAALGAGALL